MQPQQQHERPTTAPLPEPKRQRVGDHEVATIVEDDSAFWLAAAQETSAIVARGTAPLPAAAAPPLRSTAARPSITAPTATIPTQRPGGPLAPPSPVRGASATAPARRPPTVSSTPSGRAPPLPAGPTASRPPAQQQQQQPRPAQALAPPCLFGVSTVPRVRPPMAVPDEPDDSYRGGGGGFSRHQRQPSQSPTVSAPQQSRPSGPPTLFSGTKALPPPVIAPYVPSAPSSSSSSSLYARGDTQPRPGHDVAIEGIFCKCAGGTREPKTAVTRGGNNAGRRYYMCQQRNQSGGCDFYLWHDEHGKARAAPGRDPRAPHYREHLAHDLLYASGGRTAERLVVLAREAAVAGAAASGSSSSSTPGDAQRASATATAWVEAVTDRWHVTRPVGTDPTETNAIGATRRMPLVDLDLPMGDTARAACHPHVARQIACTALLAHMFALRGWRVVVQPPLMAFYQHVHLYVARGRYDKEAYWVRVEPAQRLDPRDPPDTPVQYESLWVQTAGPDPDAPGWLTGSHVDLVAFEADEGFLLVDRRRLWRYVDRHVMSAPGATATPQNPGAAAAVPVTDPAQADHRLLDMGAVGQSPHERRTLLSLQALFQHDDVDRERHRAAPAKAKVVVEETMLFDPAVAGPYFARMGRVVPAAIAAAPTASSATREDDAQPADGATAQGDDGQASTSAPPGDAV